VGGGGGKSGRSLDGLSGTTSSSIACAKAAAFFIPVPIGKGVLND